MNQEPDEIDMMSESDIRDELRKLVNENIKLRQGIREIYEVWAGSESCKPLTATEGYQQHLIEEMRDIAADNLGHDERVVMALSVKE